jgi:hypothetical protein
MLTTSLNGVQVNEIRRERNERKRMNNVNKTKQKDDVMRNKGEMFKVIKKKGRR